MLQMELQERIGDNQAVEFVSILAPEEVGTAVQTTVRNFQEKAENGRIPRLDRLYLPVVFFAEQLEVKSMAACIRQVAESMRRFGFEEEYDAGFYSVFDYEEMDKNASNACKRQLDLLQQDEKCKLPLGIFTQDNMMRTVEQKYLKAIQAIAMHIFQQCISGDIVKIPKNSTQAVKYTLGYWKLDVLKYKISEYLLEMIDSQNRQLMPESAYYDQIGKNIEKITDVDLQRYQKVFMRMPVRQLKLARGYYSIPEMMRLLYEDDEAFTHFLMENIPDSGAEEYVKAFLQMDVGNLYAVTEQLEGTLLNWKEAYSKDRDSCSWYAGSREHTLRVTKGTKLTDIIESLCNYCWTAQGELFQLERRIRLSDAVIVYLHSQEFAEKRAEIALRNREYANRLKIMKGESLLLDGIKLDGPKWEENKADRESLHWDMDLLSIENLQRLSGDIDRIQAKISLWMKEYAGNVLAQFAAGLGERKRKDAMKSYYAARLDIPKSTYEKEYLFLGKAYQTINTQELRQMVSTQMPRAEIEQCDWETDYCLECFAIREIEDLSEIYAMD